MATGFVVKYLSCVVLYFVLIAARPSASCCICLNVFSQCTTISLVDSFLSKLNGIILACVSLSFLILSQLHKQKLRGLLPVRLLMFFSRLLLAFVFLLLNSKSLLLWLEGLNNSFISSKSTLFFGSSLVLTPCVCVSIC